jgi:hypothetical protein
MIDKEIFREIVRESFQDFDLLDYNYSVNFTLGALEVNRSGSFTLTTKRHINNLRNIGRGNVFLFNNYIDLYNSIGMKPFKDCILLDFYFKPKKKVNKAQFDDFFEDGMVKLNSLLERHNIVIPFEKIEYNGEFFSNHMIISSEEKEIIVEFSSRLKNKSK